MTEAVPIRDAEPADVPRLLAFVRELAQFEGAAERVTGTEERLHAALFGPEAVAEAVLAEAADPGAPAGDPVEATSGAHGRALTCAEPVGFALFYTTFSTWQCLPGIWLEDLYVRPGQRGGGVGYALFTHVARMAVRRGCGRMEWSALDWNTSALDFYKRLGAELCDEWTTHRLEGSSLRELALK